MDPQAVEAVEADVKVLFVLQTVVTNLMETMELQLEPVVAVDLFMTTIGTMFG